MKRSTKSAVLSVALAGLLASAGALADREDIRQLGETRISLSDAIGIAERHQNGRAFEAGIDDDSFAPVYEVTVVTTDNKVYELVVDGITGEVRNVREDRD